MEPKIATIKILISKASYPFRAEIFIDVLFENFFEFLALCQKFDRIENVVLSYFMF